MSPVSAMAVYRSRIRSSTHLWPFQARGCAWGAPGPDFGYGGGPSNAGRITLDMMGAIGANRFECVYHLRRRGSHTIKIVKPMPALPGVALRRG